MKLKFRCWNGETMVSPDYIDREGTAHWKENSIPESSENIMLWTGLLDKQGVEIYEGDIVQYTAQITEGDERREEKTRATVEFEFGSFVANPPNSNYDTDLQGSELWMEVIGNIYENPELVKDE